MTTPATGARRRRWRRRRCSCRTTPARSRSRPGCRPRPSRSCPASTASSMASWRPKKPLPPRLIDTTWQPCVRAQRTALATSLSKTWTTLSVARIGTSVAPVATPCEAAAVAGADDDAGRRRAVAGVRERVEERLLGRLQRIAGLVVAADDVAVAGRGRGGRGRARSGPCSPESGWPMRIPLPAARAGGISASACGTRIASSAQSRRRGRGSPAQSPVRRAGAVPPRPGAAGRRGRVERRAPGCRPRRGGTRRCRTGAARGRGPAWRTAASRWRRARPPRRAGRAAADARRRPGRSSVVRWAACSTPRRAGEALGDERVDRAARRQRAGGPGDDADDLAVGVERATGHRARRRSPREPSSPGGRRWLRSRA